MPTQNLTQHNLYAQAVKVLESDFFVNDMGTAFVSQRKAEELLGLGDGTLRKHISRHHKNANTYNGLDAKLLQSVTTYYAIESRSKTEKALKFLAQLAEAGAKAFIYRMAGYQIDAKPMQAPAPLELSRMDLIKLAMLGDHFQANRKSPPNSNDSGRSSMNTNNTTQQPIVMFTPCVTPSIASTIETCLHFARLAEVAAVAGVAQESIEFTCNHVASLLDDLISEDHAAEVAACAEYATNACTICNTVDEEYYGAIKLLVKALIDLQERVERYDRYDMLGAGFGGAV